MHELHQAILRQKSPIQVGDYAYLSAKYEAANLQQGGRVIKPPRYVWYLHTGLCGDESALKVELKDEQIRNQLLSGLARAESFELSSLGMFYKREEGFELFLAAAGAYRTGPNYGLPSLNLQPIKAAAPKIPQIPVSQVKSSSLWWLQAAAVILLIVLLNVMAVTFFSENGGLNFKQVVKASLFDSLKQPNPFMYEEDSLEEVLPVKISTNHASQLLDSTSVDDNELVPANNASALGDSTPMVPTLSIPLAEKETPASIKNKTVEISPNQVAQEGHAVKIVIGAFGSLDNARLLQSKTESKGFEVAVEPMKSGKLHRVVIVSKVSEQGVEAQLSKIKQEINSQAWVLAE